MPLFPKGWLSNQNHQQGLIRPAVTTLHNFPSVLLASPTGHNQDSGGSGLLMGITLIPQRSGITLKGLRFFADASGHNPNVQAACWDGSDTLLASSAEFGADIAAGSGWNTILFTLPIALTVGATYKLGAAIIGSTQYYTAQANAFSAAKTNSDFQAPVSAGFYNYVSAAGAPWSPSFTPNSINGNSSAWYGIDADYVG